MNKVYGWRILQFIENKTERFSGEIINRDVIDVDRTVPGWITITSSRADPTDIYTLNGIIAEKIRIERRQ